MEKLYSFSEFSLETKHAFKHSFLALRSFARMGHVLGSCFIGLLFNKPKLVVKRGPGLFDVVEPGSPPGPHPFASPPVRFF